MAVISNLYTYHLKSCKGTGATSVTVSPGGFRNDRCLAVVGSNGQMFTGRQYPALVLLEVSIKESVIYMDAPNIESISARFPDPREPRVNARLFTQNVRGIRVSEKFDEWISRYLGTASKIIYIGDNPISPEGFPDAEMGYTDGSPVHLITLPSLNRLNELLPSDVTGLHFRPNIVVDGTLPFEEDSWTEITIGTVRFKVKKLCQRCVFTSVDPRTGKKDEDVEPLLTLSRFRRERSEPLSFGIDLVPLESGILSRGDALISVSR